MKRLIPMVFLACAVQVGSATPAAAMPGAAGADEFAVTTLVPGVSSRAQGSPGPLVAGRLVADRDAPAVPAFGPMHGAMADPGADRARPDPGTLGYVEQIESPPDPNTFEYYSSPVAILGDTAFVGAPNAVGGGAVFVYTYGDGAWNSVQTLTPDPPGGQFGIGIAIDGDTAVIGANTASIDGNDLQGRAFVFHRTQGTWTQTAMLVADNGTAGDVFGQTVALKGDTALIGAPQVNSVGNQYQGAAYVFRNVEGVWKQVVELTADDGQANDYFSKSLGLASETEAIIGCSGCAVDGVNGHGAAWVFRNLEGSWTQVQKLVPDDPPDGTFFGYSLSVDGAIVLIGAQFAGAANTVDYQGAAYVFTESDGTWSQAQKLFADNGDDGDGFGRAVALSGSTALVGAWGDNGYQGSAYLFKATGGLFAQQTQFIASDGAANDYYGYDVAVSDATALVGAYAKTVDELPYVGQAYFYTTGVPGDTVFRDGFDGAP